MPLKKFFKKSGNKDKHEFKKGKKKKKEVPGEPGFTAPFGYLEDDGYLITGKKSMISIFDTLFQYGTNNPADIGWTNIVLPKANLKDVDIHLVQRQRGMSKDEEEKVFSKYFADNADVLQKDDTKDARSKNKNNDRLRDIRVSSSLAGQEETIVDTDMLLILKGKDADSIEQGLADIKESYKDRAVKGIMFFRKTGEQLSTLKNIFDKPKTNPWHNSDMISVSASRLFLPSSGFSDNDGEDVGIDINSIIPNQHARLNLSDVKNAVIYSGGSTVNATFADDLYSKPVSVANGGSVMATVLLGKAFWLGDRKKGIPGKRTHHIILNDFNYRLDDSLYFDMSKEAINPLEVQGTPETVHRDFLANLDKVVNIMMLLLKTKDVHEIDQYEVNLHDLLYSWYVEGANGNGIYTKNPTENPALAQRVLASEYHDKYPTLRSFLPVLQNNVIAKSLDGDRPKELAETLYKRMNNLFTEYQDIFDRPTTLPDVYKSNERNIYYDIAKVTSDEKVKGAMLLNVLSYVVNRALEGEVIIIHGLDSVQITPSMLDDYKKIMNKKNIGKVIVFDDAENEEINPDTFSKFIGGIKEQDFVCIGSLTDKDVERIKWFDNLPITARRHLLETTTSDGIYYMRRNRDRLSSVIRTNVRL